jgi:hypothetical protein
LRSLTLLEVNLKVMCVAELAQLTRLTQLAVHVDLESGVFSDVEWGDAPLRSLAAMPALKHLRVRDVGFADHISFDAMEALGQSAVERLDVGYINDTALEALVGGGAESLRELHVQAEDLDDLSDQALRNVAMLPSLTSLSIASTSHIPEAVSREVTDAGVGALAIPVHIASLRELNLQGSRLSCAGLAQHVARCTALTALNLRMTAVYDLSPLTSLRM